MNEPGPGIINGLLHNSGAPPRRVINYTGVRSKQRGLWFAVPEDARPGAIELATRVGLGRARSTVNAERKLRALVDELALTLPFPPAAVVTSDRSLATEEETDFATIITVLAKSSGHVYLRDKEPNFDRVTPGTILILLVPPNWRPE